MRAEPIATSGRSLAFSRGCRTSPRPRPVVVESSNPDATSPAALTSTWRARGTPQTPPSIAEQQSRPALLHVVRCGSSCARWTRRLRSRRQHRRLAVDPGSGASGPQRRPKRRRDSGSPSDGGRWARAWKALGGCAYLREVADAQSGAGQQFEVLRGGDELGEVGGETDVLADRGREPARTVEPQRRPQQRRADCLVSMQGDAQAPQAQSCRPLGPL